MEIGKTYGLSREGLRVLSLMGFIPDVNFTANTQVVVVSKKQPCNCGSRTSRHTDDCASRYQEVKLPSEKRVFLSDSDVVNA